MSKYIDDSPFPQAAELNAAAVAAHREAKAARLQALQDLQDQITVIAVTVDPLTTTDTTPPLSGLVNDPNADLELVVDGQTHMPTNNADGTWSLADGEIDPALAVGTYDVAVTATSEDGDVESTDLAEDELVIE